MTTQAQTNSQIRPTGRAGTDDVAQLHDVLEEFSIVLLGTIENTDGAREPVINARPMAIAKLDDDCTLYFVTRIDSQKVDEAEATSSAQVFGQSKLRFFSLRGRVETSRDRNLIRELWSTGAEVWLHGPDDARAAVLIVHPEAAELWDESGANSLKYLFDAAKALITGAAPEHDPNQHRKVAL